QPPAHDRKYQVRASRLDTMPRMRPIQTLHLPVRRPGSLRDSAITPVRRAVARRIANSYRNAAAIHVQKQPAARLPVLLPESMSPPFTSPGSATWLGSPGRHGLTQDRVLQHRHLFLEPFEL